MLKATVHSEFGRVPTRRPSVVHLMIKLATDALPGDAGRTPLNLGLVLDRSGSMSGNKLAYTKQATEHLLRRLQAADTSALVVYDDHIDVLPGDKDAQLQALRSVGARGMTNLSGGWLRGLSLVERGLPREHLNRVLLMTDGHANEGVTNPDQLVEIGRKYLAKGIRTTTLGFGDDFNEDLLATIAEESGGNFYYIDSPDKAPAVFLEELGELSAIVGQNLEVVLHTEAGVTVAHDYSVFPGPSGDRSRVWQMGDLYASDERLLLISLNVPAGFEVGQRPVAQVGVRYTQTRGEVGERRLELPALVNFDVSLEAGVEPNPEVARETLVLSAARAKEQAILLADRGDHAASIAQLTACSAAIRQQLAAPNGLAQADLALLADEAELCDSLSTSFAPSSYDKTSRKKAKLQAYRAKNQRGAYRK